MVGHIFNSTKWEAEAGTFLQVRDQPGLHSEFQVRQTLSQINN